MNALITISDVREYVNTYLEQETEISFMISKQLLRENLPIAISIEAVLSDSFRNDIIEDIGNYYRITKNPVEIARLRMKRGY